MDQNGPEWSPGLVSNLSRVTNIIFFLISWTLEREQDSVQGVVGLHMRCAKKHRNQPKLTKLDAQTTEEKFVTSMCCNAIVTIFVEFWCISRATLCPLHDLIGLISPFKCPSNPEKDHIGHSGQIQNSLLCHAMTTILVHFYPFWCIQVHLTCNPMTPP